MIVVHADCVVRGDADEIRDGAVVLDDSGRVLMLGRPPRSFRAMRELLSSAFTESSCRGSSMRIRISSSALFVGRFPEGGLLKWVDHLIAVRAEQGPEQDAAAIDGAVAELDAFGTAAVGEVTNTLAAVPALVRLGIAGCVFHEVVGVLFEQASRRLQELPEVVRSRLDAWPDGDLAYAPSPHALYTTHSEVIRRVMKASAHGGSRVSVHLGEHASERRFLESGDGPILEWMTSRLGLARTQIEWPGMSPVEFADSLGLLAPHVACVHLTDARPEELARVAASGAHAYSVRVEPLHRSEVSAAARCSRSGPATGARHRFARVELVARCARGGQLSTTEISECSRARARAHGDVAGSVGSRQGRRGSYRSRIASGPVGDRRRSRRRRVRIHSSERGGPPALDRSPVGTASEPRDRASGSGCRMRGADKIRTYAGVVAIAHTVFALPFAATAVVLSLAVAHVPLSVFRVFAMLFCMVCARTSAMAFNRWADRDIDARNPRTSGRHLPAGAVGAGEVIALCGVSGVGFIVGALALGRWPGILAPAVLGVLLGYSYAKRFTWAAHLWLGLRWRSPQEELGSPWEPLPRSVSFA